MNTENINMATPLRRGFLAAVLALLISAHPHAPTGSAQSLSPALPAKEYVYANAKLLAVEVSFALSVTPPTASIPPGAAQDYTVTVAAPASFTGQFTFAANNLPPEITPTFNPPTITGSGSTTLAPTSSLSAPVASWPFTVTVTSERITASGQAAITVAAALPVLITQLDMAYIPGLHSGTASIST